MYSRILTPDERVRFIRDGYLVVRDVLPRVVAENVRRFLLGLAKQYAPTDRGVFLIYNFYNKVPEMRWLMFWEPLVDVLKQLLSDPLYCCKSSSMHRDRWSPWHRDTDGQACAGFNFHNEPDCLMIQVTHYLQDGLSLDFVPGSHTSNEVDVEKFVTVDSKMTDVVIFDTRLVHRGTLPEDKENPPTKLAVYNLFSLHEKHAKAYDEFIHGQKKTVYKYLDDLPVYSEPLVEAAKSKGIVLV